MRFVPRWLLGLGDHYRSPFTHAPDGRPWTSGSAADHVPDLALCNRVVEMGGDPVGFCHLNKQHPEYGPNPCMTVDQAHAWYRRENERHR